MQTCSEARRGTGREPSHIARGRPPDFLRPFHGRPLATPLDTIPTWNNSFESVEASASRPGDSHSWGSGGPGTFGFPAAEGYVPGYGVSFRPFIAYDAVEPFDTQSPWINVARGGTRSITRPAVEVGGSKSCAPDFTVGFRTTRVQRLGCHSSRSRSAGAGISSRLSDRFYKGFCRSTESPVERYLCLKQESRETPRTFLWKLNAAATKANVDFHSASGCHRHVNQFLKNLRDRELQLSLQGRVYFTTDELEDVLKQVEEMEQGMRRKPVNDVQFGRHKPQGVGAGVATRGEGGDYAALTPDTEGLRWEDEDDSGYGYQYDAENDEAYDGLVDQEKVFRAEALVLWNERNGRSPSRPDPRGGGPPGAPRSSTPCPVCNKLGHTRERCWQQMKCDRRRECEACCQLHPAGECAVIKAFKEAAQRGQLQGLPEEVLQRLRPEATPALNY
ncbi:hypothetical protein PHMEG_00024249 [Phytophthora megakarya]|uniref:Eukaryotic/viral aspartic protease n=1 Tax=Phytophthora megakarya TaxID=4795 RepID=A0A225VGE6_9STRA|nr:hypothetical protein PHMEG_00024249 [Phytophthora megakarya]